MKESTYRQCLNCQNNFCYACRSFKIPNTHKKVLNLLRYDEQK